MKSASAKILQLIPPWECDKAFEAIREGLSKNNPDALHEVEELLLEAPLKQLQDGERPFLLCELNRYGDSYRSPWSNTLHPPSPEQQQNLPMSNDTLNTFESHVNEVWDAYRQLYYGKDAVGSVYLKESSSSTTDVAFLACFLIQKETSTGGRWTSSHFVLVGNVTATGSTKYHVHSTVHVTMEKAASSTTTTNAGARLTKEVVSDTYKLRGDAISNPNPSHLENIGKLIESIEIDLRTSLEQIHFPKAKESLSQLRQEARPGGPPGGMMMPMMGGGMGMNPMMMGSLNKALSARSGLKKTGKALS